MAKDFETYTNPRKVTVELTVGQIEAIIEALQTTNEVLHHEREDTGEPFSPLDRRLLRAMRGADSAVGRGL